MSGTKINLTVHESSEAGDKVMDVRLRLEDAVINLRYDKYSSTMNHDFNSYPSQYIPKLEYNKELEEVRKNTTIILCQRS